MAERESLNLWSTTAASNNTIDPSINYAEGQLPGTLNNSNRSEMAALARFYKDINGSLTTAGSANAYTLTINNTWTAYANGQILSFKASFANTAAATLNVTNADAAALGAKAIRGPGDIALVSGQIKSGGRYLVQYDTTANAAAGAWLLLNPAFPATSAELLSMISDETGTGALVFANTPTLVTPALGAATATTINGATIDNTAWSTSTPTVTLATGGPPTTSTATIRYKQLPGKVVAIRGAVSLSNLNGGSGNVIVTLPVTESGAIGNATALTGYNASTAVLFPCVIGGGAGTITFVVTAGLEAYTFAGVYQGA